MNYRKTVRRLVFLSLFAMGGITIQAQSVTKEFKETPLSGVLKEVEKQTGFSIMYNNDDLSGSRAVTRTFEDASIEEVLKAVLPKNLEFKLQNKMIVISRRGSQSIQQKQVRKVSGVIVDEAGEPVIGANVLVKGTTNGVITDIDGNYFLNDVPDDAVISISYIGYQPKEFKAGSKELAKVVLQEDSEQLDEVVVVGYGVQKKVNLTGAVGVIDSKMLNKRPVTNAAAALQGADPSMLLTLGSGSIEGRHYSVNIRGAVSLNSGEPLILVDGIEADLSQVNPNDISSVSVLKDASACDIYGAKASAGVVLISTKNGNIDKTTINYNGRFGISSNTTSTDFITQGYDYITFENEFYQSYKGKGAWTYTDEQIQMMYDRRNDVTEHPDRPWIVTEGATDVNNKKYTYLYLGNYDWYDYFFKRTRPETEHNVSISGGSKKLNYYISGRYLYREGFFDNNQEDKYDGYSFRSKINAEITPWLHYSNNISFERSEYKYGGYWEQDGSEGLNSNGILYNLNLNISPTYLPVNPDGTRNVQPGYMADTTSPLASGRAAFLEDANENARITNYWTLTNRFTFDLIKKHNLKFIFDYTYRRRDYLAEYRSLPISNAYDNANRRMYKGSDPTVPQGYFSNGSLYDFYQEDRNYHDGHVVNGYFQYDLDKNKHNFSATVGANFEGFRRSNLSVRQKGTLSRDLGYIDMAQAVAIEKMVERNSAYRTLGYFVRFNYNYDGKYLVEFSSRYDGSSRFAAGDRWGFFPSVSGGWRISEEKFWKNSVLNAWWNNMKVRLSYGSLGNQQVSDYYYWETISTASMGNYTFDGTTLVNYSKVSDPITSGLTWETVYTYNLGLDFGFLNNRLNVSMDTYIRDTKDMLTTSMTLPDVYGAVVPKSNAADLRTKGYELTLSWRDSKKLMGKSFNYGISASLGDSKTIITKYNNPNKLLSDKYEGMELGEIWGYKVAGLFKTDEEAAAYQAQINDKAVNNGVYTCVAPYNKLMAGDVKFMDLNGDNVINNGKNTVDDPGDMRVIGNSLPRYTYSFSGDFNWNGLDFQIFFQGVGKIDWMPATGALYFWNTYANQRPSFIPVDFPENCWSEENSDAYFPRRRTKQTAGKSALGVKTDRYLQNAAYLRLKNLSVGYSIPISKRYVEKLRVYVSGENLAYWSPLKKYCTTIDPEIAVSQATNDCMYPYSKTFSLGIDITF